MYLLQYRQSELRSNPSMSGPAPARGLRGPLVSNVCAGHGTERSVYVVAALEAVGIKA